ncbi:MAG TPA: prolipoprotein diacylglyceryl transferase [Thermoanaerobaculia bacterium]|jgi:phosphatidylglycerol:prolipoprotein diacylglycerol transferase|nr:prolipoprotein diacylglyceryl transferase [Thermoanaerobaculia bacterium]
MIKEIFHIGSFSISPFGVMLVFSFLGSYLQLRWGMKRLGIGDDEDASAIVFAAGLGGILGAKIYYAILNMDWRLLFDRSGLVWYGGFILGTAGVLWMMRRRRLPAWPMLDVATPALALGYAIGRIGCFLVGDDYGRPTDLPWGVAFPVGLPETTAGNLRQIFHMQVPSSVPDDALVRVHPTQLYETAIALAVWAFAVWLFKRRPQTGTVALTVFGLMAVERFLIEFLRAKDDRFFGNFTLAQVISMAVLVIALGIAWVRRQRLQAREA